MGTSRAQIHFHGPLRYWDPVKGVGLAVVDIPSEQIPAFGGLKQQRVSGTIDRKPFASSVMSAGGGRLALSVSRAMMKEAGVGVGDVIDVEISAVGRHV